MPFLSELGRKSDPVTDLTHSSLHKPNCKHTIYNTLSYRKNSFSDLGKNNYKDWLKVFKKALLV